jgi:hypothetical protein
MTLLIAVAANELLFLGAVLRAVAFLATVIASTAITLRAVTGKVTD